MNIICRENDGSMSGRIFFSSSLLLFISFSCAKVWFFFLLCRAIYLVERKWAKKKNIQTGKRTYVGSAAFNYFSLKVFFFVPCSMCKFYRLLAKIELFFFSREQVPSIFVVIVVVVTDEKQRFLYWWNETLAQRNKLSGCINKNAELFKAIGKSLVISLCLCECVFVFVSELILNCMRGSESESAFIQVDEFHEIEVDNQWVLSDVEWHMKIHSIFSINIYICVQTTLL